MPSPKLGFSYFGGIGDCLRILTLFHGPLLQLINRGRTPVRWNEGGTAGTSLVDKYIINRIPGYYSAGAQELFYPILDHPRWHRFFRWTRTPIAFQLTPDEEAALPRLSSARPSIAICPHHNGLRCKALPFDSINQLLTLLRDKLDAEYYIFDEKIDPARVNAPCIGGLNLTQAMVLTGRFDAVISVDSWQKYILGMLGKPQTCLVVDFRINELYTHEATPAAVYQEFFRWRMRPEEILGFTHRFAEFQYMTAAEVPPHILADHLLAQAARNPRLARHLKP